MLRISTGPIISTNPSLNPTQEQPIQNIDFSQRDQTTNLDPAETTIYASTERFVQEIPSKIKFELGLKSWCDEAKGTKEHETRISVSEKIKKSYNSKDTTLDLEESSDLSSLPDQIGDLINLTELSLEGCSNLTFLPVQIGNLGNLTELILRGCSNLTLIPDQIGRLINLKLLDLAGCSNLTNLPIQIGSLVNLTELIVRGCSNLTLIPDQIDRLVNLKLLDLAGCSNLTLIPDQISRLVKLELLDLANCSKLTHLPNGIGHLTNLKLLDLEGCSNLGCLPNTIGGLINLTQLKLEGCSNLRSIPDEIGALVNLLDLSLEGSYNLRDLPNTMGRLINLTRLNLDSCYGLTSVPAEIGDLLNLKLVYLNNCSSLASLPNSLARLPYTCYINTEHCGLNARASLTFQDALTQARSENRKQGPRWSNTVYEPRLSTTNTFSETFALYLELIQQTFPSEDLSLISQGVIDQLTDHEKNLLNQFLKKITTCKDFIEPRTQGGVLLTILQLLKQCLETPPFRENLFILINDALSSCSDRTAITINRMEVERRLFSPLFSSDLNHLAHFLITYRRLQYVFEESIKIVRAKNLGDEIEPILFLQIKLKNFLDLPVVTEGMLYPKMAMITDAEIEAIRFKIMSETQTLEQQQNILCEGLETRYDEKGKPIAIGPFSITNPFQIPIHEIWQKQLTKQYPNEFTEIEPPDDKQLGKYFSKKEHLQYGKLTHEEQRIPFITKIHAKKLKKLVKKLTTRHLSKKT